MGEISRGLLFHAGSLDGITSLQVCYGSMFAFLAKVAYFAHEVGPEKKIKADMGVNIRASAPSVIGDQDHEFRNANNCYKIPYKSFVAKPLAYLFS